LRLSSPFVVAEGIDFTDPRLRRRIMRAANRIAARGSIRPGRDLPEAIADMSTSRPSTGN
jgi:hypothetical protein